MPESLAQAHHGERKAYRRGTHRVLTPEQTAARVAPYKTRMGITRLAILTGLDRVGIPVAVACRPNARSLSVSQGKGLDEDAARASALMESVELWHAEHIDLPLRLASAQALGSCVPVADLERIARLPGGAVDGRDLLWVEAQDWLGGGPRWLPLEAVSADYRLPLAPGSGVFSATTNGLASGNSFAEAALHGLCEVLERDATTIWTLSGQCRQAATGLDLATVHDPWCRQALERFAAAGVELRVWSLGDELGLPVFCCLAWPADGDAADPELGAGCHPCREVALLRALTEAAQARVTFIAGARDDLGADLYRPAARARRREQSRRLLAAHRACRKFTDLPSRDSPTVEEDLRWTLERVRSLGLEQVLIVDLSKVDPALVVVKVVVPGLEGPGGHHHCDCAPGERARRILGSAR